MEKLFSALAKVFGIIALLCAAANTIMLIFAIRDNDLDMVNRATRIGYTGAISVIFGGLCKDIAESKK